MACFQKLLRLNIKVLGCVKQFRCQSTVSNVLQTHNVSQLPVLTHIKNPWIWQQNTQIESPIPGVLRRDVPRVPFFDPIPAIEEIKAPGTDESKHEKQAVKLIVIRRHKMRKHKLKKLRKKMKFEWAKRRQKRELRKEKEFQAGLIAQIKEAESFSAEQYVAEKIQKATETPIPRFWKGKRLPEFIIREKLGLPPK